MNLFRPESLHSQRQSWLGAIHVMQPARLLWLTFGVLAALVAVSTFLFWAETGRRARLEGVVMPESGLLDLPAGRPGRLLAVHAAEGDRVQPGQALFEVQVEAEVPGAGARAALQETFDTRSRSVADAARDNRRRQEIRQAELQARQQALTLELTQLDSQIRWHQERLVLAEQALARLQDLRQGQFASEAQVHGKTEDVLGLRAEGAGLARQRLTLQRELRTLQAELRGVELDRRRDEELLRREGAEVAELAARETLAASPREQRALAPVAGQVALRALEPGQPVQAGQTVLSLWPAGQPLQAWLYAPSRAVGFLQAGQPVRLRVQAYPYQKFGWVAGTVQRVARSPQPAAALPPWVLPAAVPEPLYRVVVTLDPAALAATERPLLPGMRLEADVVLEQRRLMEWMAEPLLAWWRR
ncbi:HlyD family secretion protein [Ideonella livida]|uniref:HlyD family efflux transporter periplasmic adaptor subunit n=1 Tax=Ideonella livida TaxID=2707176 RepID=A0A7C9PJE4_9BURK|nr:HlyD family efflux transporter periplasmic adaptor subunit [Ideonella livida]NDY92711.1 HlyD family efflux transporter periplasmic adaptor subunit [Ideonella livida]